MGRYIEESMDYTPEEWADMRALVRRLRNEQQHAKLGERLKGRPAPKIEADDIALPACCED
jgi:hypothetical protein